MTLIDIAEIVGLLFTCWAFGVFAGMKIMYVIRFFKHSS